MPPSWYLDELAHAGPEHLDAAYVAGYDRKARVDPRDDIEALQRLGQLKNSIVVDLGAGTGTFALAAAPLCRRVVAVDVSAAMLNVLRREAESRGLRNVECVRSGFVSYAHIGEPADFVHSRHALHQLPDFWKAVAVQRIAGILRIGGVFRMRDLFLSCRIDEVDNVIEAWLSHASATSDVGWTRAELELHLREEYSTFTWLFEPMLAQAGLEVRDAVFSESRMYAEYTCVRTR